MSSALASVWTQVLVDTEWEAWLLKPARSPPPRHLPQFLFPLRPFGGGTSPGAAPSG